MNIEPLFPTAIGFEELSRPFNEKEMALVEQCRNDTYSNYGNVTSNNKNVLDEPVMAEIKQACLNALTDYIQKTSNPKYDVKPYITQSWLNYTEPKQFHHRHEHPNSFISGVIYINADKDMDKIIFSRNTYSQIQLEPKEYNPFNSNTWWFPVGSGDIVLFPSGLTHEVEATQGEHTRISLAFNTFLSGTIGDSEKLTLLNQG